MNTMSKGGHRVTTAVPSYVPSLLESNPETILSLPRVLKGRLIEFLITAVQLYEYFEIVFCRVRFFVYPG